MTIAAGTNKQTTFAKQTGLGVPKVGAGGQILRRENSIFALAKATYESDEIVSHRQSTGSRHGLQSPTGKLTGLLSPGTYKLLMASQMRKDFVAGSTTGALTNVTAAVTSGASGTFTRAAGSYLTDGFKIGDVIRWTGWATTGVPNNTHNFQITALTATVITGTMLDGVAVGGKAAGDSVTATVVGKKTLAPMTAHTNDYFTFEEWYPDISQSELFTDCKQNMVTIDLPASGNAKVNFDLISLGRTLAAAQSFTTPTVETTTGICAAVTGLLLVNGAPVANVTGVQIKVDGGANASGPVIGSNFSPDITMGRIKVSGSFTAYFQDAVLNTVFQAETVTSLIVVSTVDNTPASDFTAFSLGRLKLGSDSPDDGEKGIMRTYSFVAELNSAGGAALANDQTIMSVQDSAA